MYRRMAECAEPPNLWEYDESALISQHDDLKDFIIESQETIGENIIFRAELWTQILKEKVVNKSTRDRIKLKGTNPDMCEVLIDEVRTVGHLRGLLIALVKDNQGYLVENLWLDPEDFKHRVRVNASPVSGALHHESWTLLQSSGPANTETSAATPSLQIEPQTATIKRPTLSIESKDVSNRGAAFHGRNFEVLTQRKTYQPTNLQTISNTPQKDLQTYAYYENKPKKDSGAKPSYGWNITSDKTEEFGRDLAMGKAILAVTELNQNLLVERIEIQVEEEDIFKL